MTKFNADYFIKFYSKIPKSKWAVGCYMSPDKEKRCAIGHLMVGNQSCIVDIDKDRKPNMKKKDALFSLFNCEPINSTPMYVNDGRNNNVVSGAHPKTRIINALKKIKKYEAEKNNLQKGGTKRSRGVSA